MKVSTMKTTCLGAGYAQEANGHEHPIDRNLVVAKFDAVQVQNTQTICGDEAIESEDLVHLNSSYKRAASLADNSSD